MALNFLSRLTGSFAMPAAENPLSPSWKRRIGIIGLISGTSNCEVLPDRLADAVKRPALWAG